MKKLLPIFFFFIATTIYSQTIDKIFVEDSVNKNPYVLGIATEFTTIGTDIKKYSFMCSIDNLTFINDNSYFFIGEKISCSGNNFYKIYYKGDKFYIKTESVFLKPEDKILLDTVNDSLKTILENNAKFYSKSLYERDLSLLNKFYLKSSKQGLAILNYRVTDESEYTDGTGFEIDIFNSTKKTIKYITLTILGYNAVNDKVGTPIVKKCIGPIDPGERGKYVFDYVWLTDIVNSCKITNVKIQYMDNSFKTITIPKSAEIPKTLKYLISD